MVDGWWELGAVVGGSVGAHDSLGKDWKMFSPPSTTGKEGLGFSIDSETR